MNEERKTKNRRAEFVQVLTAVPSRKDARKVSELLVNERLAACVQVIGPVVSTYRWHGKVETAKEWLCLAKTRKDRYRQVESAILRVHPYEVPEILAMPVSTGSRGYLAWLSREVRRNPIK